jgi:hypothetical protein
MSETQAEPTKCPEVLCLFEVLSLPGNRQAAPRKALPFLRSSYDLMRRAKSLPPPRFTLVRWGFAGCYQPLLGDGPSRRYLCGSFPGCLDPYPGCPRGALARFFPRDVGLPHVRNGSALSNWYHTATSVWCSLSGLQSFSNVQAPGFARPPDRSHRRAFSDPRRPGLLLPGTLRFVTSPHSGYASRPNRAIDGVGTLTPPDPQPCRLLP